MNKKKMLTWREETLQRCHVTIWQESAPWNHPKVKGKERTDRHYETRWLEGPRQHSTLHPHMLSSGGKKHKNKKKKLSLEPQREKNKLQLTKLWKYCTKRFKQYSKAANLNYNRYLNAKKGSNKNSFNVQTVPTRTSSAG